MYEPRTAAPIDDDHVVDVAGRLVVVGMLARLHDGRTGEITGAVRAVHKDGTIEVYDGTTAMYHRGTASQLRLIPIRKTPRRASVRRAVTLGVACV